jgi:PAS domain S-box-containing protein
MEFEVIRADGAIIWVESRITFIRDAEGNPVEILGVSRDITERKQSELELRASEVRYRSLVEHSNDAIYLLFEDHFEMVNPRFEALFGVTAAEVCAPDFDFMTLVAPQSRPFIEERGRQVQAGQSVSPRYEFSAINRAGQELEVEVSVSYITYGGGVATQGILRDVTGRKRMERVRRENEERAWKQRAAIAELVLNDTPATHDLTAVLQRITQVLAKTLDVARAGVWMLSEDGLQLACQALFADGAIQPEAAAVLKPAQFPRYFDAILSESRICVEDAQADPRTSELTAGYLQPLGITSMLDAGIIIEGELRGVICLEHVGATRTWYPDEEAFASTVASIVAQAFSTAERRRTEAALRLSEERYRTLVRNVPIGIYRNTAGPQGRFLMANPAFLAMFGYESEAELASITVADLYQNPAEHAAFSAQLLAQGSITGAELPLRRRDGCPIWGLVTARVTYKDDGEVAWFDCTLQDVTDRKQAEIALRRQLKELTVLRAVASACAQAVDEDRLIADLTHLIHQELYPETLGLLRVDAAAGVLVAHPSYAPGAAPPEGVIRLGEGLVGRTAAEGRPHRVNAAEALASCSGAAPGITPDAAPGAAPGARSQLVVPVKHGEQVLAVINVESSQPDFFTAADERLLLTVTNQLASAIQRIRLDRERQRRLIELEALHRASREVMTAGMDRERVYDSVHRIVSELMPTEAFVITLSDPARNENEVVYLVDRGGRWPLRRFPVNAGLSGYVISRGEGVLVNDLTPQSEVPVVHLGAPEHVRSIVAAPLRSGERVVGMLSAQSYQPNAYTQQDQVLLETLANHLGAGLENIRLFQQTQEQAHQVQAIVDSVPEGVLLLDAAGRVLVANPVACGDLALLSEIQVGNVLTHLGGRPLTELLGAPPQGLWHEVEVQGQHFEVIAQPIAKGLEPERWVLVVNDATQARAARRQLERQARLAAIGQLASGIAHDFRNLLTTIILYAHLGQRHTDLSPNMQHYLEIIIGQARAATGLTEQILDFARRTEIDRRPLDLVAFVGGVMAVLQRTLPEHIHISFEVGAGAHVIEGDAGRLQQVLTNLALNARDAMPHGGDLRIGLTRLAVGPGEAPPLPEMPLLFTPSAWICLSVADSGSGMTPEVQAQLFQPFFTTKTEGRGTGLGLAQVYGIVQLHSGYIDVTSATGQGTTFRIFLPAANAAITATATASASAALPSGRGETLLLVEDDPHLRQASAHILNDLGYRVLTAENGREALALFQAEHGIALLITDLVMPELGGKALLELLREQAPHLPALAMTGHATDETLESLQAAGFLEVIRKPFDLETLAHAVRRALDPALP